MSDTQEINEQMLLTRYQELCSKRDAKYSAAAPLEKELAEVVSQMEQLRVRSADLAARIEGIWGPEHLQIKKEISVIAKMLGRANGPLATK